MFMFTLTRAAPKKSPPFIFCVSRCKNQQAQFNHCLADYVAPKSSASLRPAAASETHALLHDHLGGFAVSIHGADELAEEFKGQHDDYSAIMTKALADRLAEAFAEYLHKEARIAWGFGRDEQLSKTDLIREKYRGIRPAAGYPACPDHAEKRTLFDLLDAENNIGIKLTESFAMHPGASVSGLYFSHPDSKYFGVGQIGRDQAVDYASPAKRSRIRSGKTTRAEFGVKWTRKEERSARPPIAAREARALPRCAGTESVVNNTLHIRGVA